MIDADQQDTFVRNYPNTDSQPVVYSDDELYSGISDDEEDIWLLIRNIFDPEYPYTLGQLRVVSPNKILVDRVHGIVRIMFCPTVPHCSLSTIIGLAIRAKVVAEFLVDPDMKLFIFIEPGKHNNELEINKQINDKERVSAALENPNLWRIIQASIKDAN